jgi:hypothetical protein
MAKTFVNNDQTIMTMKYIKVLISIILIFVNHTITSQTQARLIPKKGVYINTGGLDWSYGSEVSFFTPDKKHHHYYFTWWEQDIDTSVKDKTVLILGSANTAVHGTYSLKNMLKNKVETEINCQWLSEEDAVGDIVHVKFWLPFLKECTFSDGNAEFTIENIKQFNGRQLILKTGFGTFKITSSHPFSISRNDHPNPKENDYDKRAQFLQLYEHNIPLKKGDKLIRQFSIEQIDQDNKNTVIHSLQSTASEIVYDGEEKFEMEPSVILPKPESLTLKEGYYTIPAKGDKNAVSDKVVTKFREILAAQWQIRDSYFPNIKSIPDQKFEEEQYELNINGSNIIIKHKTPIGLQHALHTLVQMTLLKNGELVIPQAIVRDKPKISWRGVHMFTGPTSLALHKRMFENILLPLKINKTVIQCEQAEWTSQPYMRGGINISLQDLSESFSFFRKHNVEPIPLIQSLGHMEWLFKHRSNRHLAINPLYPYTLNAFLPEARQSIKKLWDETFRLLKPTTIHIGFDEIGMIGFHLPREKEIDLWKIQMKYMADYAKSRKSGLMIWGDMGLGPEEGPDALNGRTKERAALIRSTIRSGTYVADWHYLDDKNPEVYKPNLKIWKANKNIPIASPWLHPDNVYGFVHAAIDQDIGMLQTTWADFESSEHNMIINIEQFGAYILAMDYAWSGRKELPDRLPYHHIREWNRRFYRQALPVTSIKKHKLTGTLKAQDICAPTTNSTDIVHALAIREMEVRGFSIIGTTSCILPYGEDVGYIRFYKGKKLVHQKKLRYGVEVRSENDQRPLFDHISGKEENKMYDFMVRNIDVDELRLEDVHPGSGLKVSELTLFSDR